jgi:hypothetical protein
MFFGDVLGVPMSQTATRRVAFLLLLALILYVAFTGGM